MRQRLLHALLFLPTRGGPAGGIPGLAGEELWPETQDGERLHTVWTPARAPRRGAILLCHGNGGNLHDRGPHARLLTAAGFDVLLFDYRGYGRSSGRPSVEGTRHDARAAHAALLERAGTGRLIYLGESLGAAVALGLALERPPAGLVLQSAFTSVRAMAALHYPAIPQAVVPDAYPSLKLIGKLRAPMLVLHGERDELVPAAHGEALHAAAPEPKRLRILPGVGHNDLLAGAGSTWAEAIAAWTDGLPA